MNPSNYRPDIDGLRAFAVLGVVFFHVGFPALSGGFVGVDVFFVISGFLITRMIRNEVLSGSFSFQRFYVRRVRRLFPALFFTLTACFLAAGLLFTPQYFERFSRALVFSVLSVSNFFFWQESGYFDLDAIVKPLLHTWSLSVEEQFYFVWPGMLVLALGAHRFFAPVFLALVAVVCLVISQRWLVVSPDAVFFLAPFRAAEFAIGAILVWLIDRRPEKKTLLEPILFLGLLMIGYSMLAFDEATLFPGFNSLVPCLGTALAIYAGEARAFGKLLSNKLAVGIGLISYSLYLIHWPVVVFYRYHVLRDIGDLERCGIVLFSVVAATLMYRFVERPFRKPYGAMGGGNRLFVTTCVALGATIVVAAQPGLIGADWNWQRSYRLTAADISEGNRRRVLNFNDACWIPDFFDGPNCRREREWQVLIIGNSHEMDGYNIFRSAFDDDWDVNLIAFGNALCPIERAGDTYRFNPPGCHGSQKALDVFTDDRFLGELDAIVFSSNRPFDADKERDWHMLRDFKQRNPHVQLIVLGGYINTKTECADLINRFGSSAACKDPEYVDYYPDGELGEGLYERHSSIIDRYIDKRKLLCSDERLSSCAMETPAGIPFAYDRHHLTGEFASWIGKLMVVEYPELLTAMPRKSQR